LPKGRKGKGQLTVTSFSVPAKSLDYWIKRLDKFSIPYQNPQERFDDEAFIYFEDYDGLGLELVANNRDERTGFSYGQIPVENSIKGFYGIALLEEGYESTAGLLTHQMDHSLVSEKGNRFRFSASGKPGDYVDVLCSPDSMRGLNGAGTIHHVAFATQDDKTQLAFREHVRGKGVNPTPVLDRQYFHSIYFREPGGVLFEVATSDIGFAIDEPKEHLGEALKLPPWEEENRDEIEKGLLPISINTNKYMD
jgi:glyoxalase family protein